MPLAHLRAPRASAVGASTGPITTTPSVDPPTFAVPSADSVAPAAATAASKSLIVVANAMPAGASSGLPVMRAPAPLRARHFIPREPSAASIDTAAGAPIPAAGVASAAQPGFVFSPSVSATWPAPALLHRALAALSPHGEVEAERSAAHSQPRMTFTAGGADVHRAIERNAVEWPLVTAMRSPAGPDAIVRAEGRSSTSTYTPASPPLRAAHPGPVAMTLARRLSADTAAPTIDRALTAAAAPAAHTTSPLAELPMPAPAPTVHHTEGAHAHAHAGASRGEVDVDDIVERVWREVLSRLAVDLERRGFARWA